MNKYDKIANVIKQYSENVNIWDNEVAQEFVEALKDTAEYKLLDNMLIIPINEFNFMRFLVFHTDFEYICRDRHGVHFFEEPPHFTENNLWIIDEGNFYPVVNNFLEPDWGSSWLNEGICIQLDPFIFNNVSIGENYVWVAKEA